MSDKAIIRLYGAVPDSIVDGPGLRYAVFVQGCTHGCPGCHNPDSQPCEGGTPTSTDDLFEGIRANGLIHDVTFSGGEPFEQAAACAVLARRLKDAGYGIWAYSGYLYEELERAASLAGGDAPAPDGAVDAPAFDGVSASGCVSAPAAPAASFALDPAGVRDLLDCVDVLVDGPFVMKLKSLGLDWKGSSNQRVIDVRATRAAGTVVEWKAPKYVPEKPASW